jgi:RNA polymerase sigma-70 factor (ECF subfamily)
VLTWVLSIAHHKAVDALRRREAAPVPFDLRAIPSRAERPEDPLARIDDRLALDLALRALSREHRTVLQLMFGFDCSQSEIADIVGCSVATVKTRVFYAKRRLRDELERAMATQELA